MCGCLRHGDVDRALEHFRQASERGISLDLPLCESLATALFIKGLQGGSTEMAAWNVLDYIRQRGMEHRPEVRRGVSGMVYLVAISGRIWRCKRRRGFSAFSLSRTVIPLGRNKFDDTDES